MTDLTRLDDGPVATVYSGHRAGVPVALKVFPKRFDKRTASSFGKEQAKLSAVRRVTSILMVDGVEELPSGESAVRMELCTQSLAALVERVGPLPAADVAILGRAMATALAAAHSVGVVHGGVAPSNVLFRQNNEPVLADFGVTLRQAFTRDPLHAIEYLPPETLRTGTLNERTDLYGLGAVLHFALSGRSPHPGHLGEQPGERVLRILGEPVPAIDRRDVPVGLSTLVARLLATTPERRPPHASQVADQLTAMLPNPPAQQKTEDWDDFDTPPAPARPTPPREDPLDFDDFGTTFHPDPWAPPPGWTPVPPNPAPPIKPTRKTHQPSPPPTRPAVTPPAANPAPAAPASTPARGAPARTARPTAAEPSAANPDAASLTPAAALPAANPAPAAPASTPASGAPARAAHPAAGELPAANPLAASLTPAAIPPAANPAAVAPASMPAPGAPPPAARPTAGEPPAANPLAANPTPAATWPAAVTPAAPVTATPAAANPQSVAQSAVGGSGVVASVMANPVVANPADARSVAVAPPATDSAAAGSTAPPPVAADPGAPAPATTRPAAAEPAADKPVPVAPGAAEPAVVDAPPAADVPVAVWPVGLAAPGGEAQVPGGPLAEWPPPLPLAPLTPATDEFRVSPRDHDDDGFSDFSADRQATVLAAPLAPPGQGNRRLIRYDLLAGAALLLALLALVPLLLLRGDPEEISSTPKLPTAGDAGSDVTVELSAPTDLADKVRLSWRATRELDFAVVVAAEGEEKARVLLAEQNHTMTVDVEPGRRYCFLVQATDGDRVYESEPVALRGASCRK